MTSETEEKLIAMGAEMLAEEMAGLDLRRCSEAEIKAGCKRFAARWTAIADTASKVFLDELFKPTGVKA